jgi:flagellar hook-associated protein 3 FlgL
MRVTTNIAVDTLVSNIDRSFGRVVRFQTELSSGTRLNKLSDDPAAVQRSLSLRGELRNIEQFKKNIDDGTGWLDLHETTLADLEGLFIEARGLGVQGASDTSNSHQRRVIGEQINQFVEHAFSLSQSRYRNRFIYAGTRTAENPFRLQKDEMGAIIGVEPTGPNNGQIERETGEGITMQVNVPGSDVFEGDINAFDVLLRLRDALTTNEVDGIRASLEEVDQMREKISTVRGVIGARTNRMEITRNILDRVEVDMTSILSADEDVDLTSAIVNLRQEQDVFQAALASGNTIVPQSLMDFIG